MLLATTALSSPFLAGSAPAQNLPAGGSVAAGSVTTAQPSATQLNITQSSQSAVVNWQSFSIGQGSTVNIQQPNNTSALLNRVTGNTPSSIAGSLTANGQVELARYDLCRIADLFGRQPANRHSSEPSVGWILCSRGGDFRPM